MGWAGALGFRAPMTFVVIGGLMTSTLLSLLVIPVVYSCLDDAVGWAAKRFTGRRPVHNHGPLEPAHHGDAESNPP